MTFYRVNYIKDDGSNGRFYFDSREKAYAFYKNNSFLNKPIPITVRSQSEIEKYKGLVQESTKIREQTHFGTKLKYFCRITYYDALTYEEIEKIRANEKKVTLIREW